MYPQFWEIFSYSCEVVLNLQIGLGPALHKGLWEGIFFVLPNLGPLLGSSARVGPLSFGKALLVIS